MEKTKANSRAGTHSLMKPESRRPGALRQVLGSKLGQRFYQGATTEIAQGLLGKILLHQTPEGAVAGRIVETEAYLFEGDPACHAHRGRTKRNAAMFEAGGVAYIYLIYGMHYCFNVVTSKKDRGEAVLIRALEPLIGLTLMQRRRGSDELRNLCRGPGRLAQAMAFDRKLDGSSLISGPISIHEPGIEIDRVFSICASSRIGIRQAQDLPLRFSVKGSQFVSG